MSEAARFEHASRPRGVNKEHLESHSHSVSLFITPGRVRAQLLLVACGMADDVVGTDKHCQSCIHESLMSPAWCLVCVRGAPGGGLNGSGGNRALRPDEVAEEEGRVIHKLEYLDCHQLHACDLCGGHRVSGSSPQVAALQKDDFLLGHSGRPQATQRQIWMFT
eukprot:1352859-Amphidinium_carterae.2